MRPLRVAQAAVVTVTAMALAATGSTPALALGPAAALRPATSAARASDTVVVLAGSAHYLAYADFPPAANGTPLYAEGELHVLTARGANRDLGSGFGTTEPGAATTADFSLVGSMLTGSAPSDPSTVEWWDLKAGTSGLATLPTGATWQGSAPDGWVLVKANERSVAVESVDGDVQSYGQPLPDQVHTLSSSHGIVSLGATTHALAFQPWDTTGSPVRLDSGSDIEPDTLSCGSASGAIVGCLGTSSTTGAVLDLAVPVTGAAPREYAGCGTTPVAVGQRLIFVCGTNTAHARFATSAGSVRRSAAGVSAGPGVSAFDSFATTGARQEAVVDLRSAAPPPAVLVARPNAVIGADDASLRVAAFAVEARALSTGALTAPAPYHLPAQILQASVDALISAARRRDPTLAPIDTRSVMGSSPRALRHHHRGPSHLHVTATHTLDDFTHALPDAGALGFGVHRTHGGAFPAHFRTPDGVFVDPALPKPAHPTIGMVALRSALRRLGQPYVWAAAGPSTFDCSGLTQWAYAHAGLRLTHFSGDQWNEGRLIPARDILPGDLVLFDHLVHHHEVIHHVGIYLAAGWMLNAPFTGQYVNVVRVSSGVAGVVRP